MPANTGINKCPARLPSFPVLLSLAAIAVSAGCRMQGSREDRFELQWDEMVAASVGAGNIIIEVTEMRVDSLESSALSAAFAYVDENIAVTAGSPPRALGLRAATGSTKLSVIADAVAKRSKTFSRTTRSIAVLPGHTGVLEVAEAGAGGRYWSLEVTPVVDVETGDILLRLRPLGLSAGSVTNLDTTVRVRSGSLLLLAARENVRNDSATGLSGVRSAGSGSRILVALRAIRSRELR